MKKILLPVFFASLMFVSCENEVVSIENDTNNSKIKLVSFNPDGTENRISSSNDMLQFESWAEFEETANELDRQVEAYDDAFINTYRNLTLEQLDNKEDELKFNNQKPMIDFENSLGFNNSLRKRFDIENQIYLNDEVSDNSKNPNITLAFSNGELSLVNDKQQVMIGNVIHHFNNNRYITISQDYGVNLDLIESNNPSIGNQPGVVVVVVNPPSGSGGVAPCSGWKANGTSHDYTSGRKVERVAKIRSVVSYTKTEKMTIHYKRKNNKWRESRANMAVDISQALRNDNCNFFKNNSKPRNTIKPRKRRDIHLTEYLNQRLKAQSGNSLTGSHIYDNYTTSYTLAW